MKKNSKGFTMVEIIAVVAILGILIMVTMPRLLNLVTSSKDEIYVQDAKKLIAQARYVMGKNSNEIEKPMAGNYIVLSLNYLGSTNFSSPPNGGSYLTEASFVVVKNVQKPDSDIEDFKYSAVLIESAKEGFYRGIKMSSEEELNTNSAKTLVTYFNDDDIVYIDEDAAINNSCEEERCTLSEEYINTYATDENMKSEEGTIVGKYNNIITKQDGEEVEVFSAPTFTARAISDSGSLYALGGNLYVVARDADNELSDLKVCVKISKNSNDSYPDVNDSTYCKPYGSEESLDNGTYKLAFDLANYDFSYDEREVAYFYIIVSDPEGNYSRKKVDYEVHKNTAPVINLFEIAKHKDESRNFNMPFVSLRGSFVDDMDDISKLKFCLVDSNKENDNRECTDYHDYNYYFNGNNKYYFKKEDGSTITKPDGSTHYLTLYVKDSNNLVTSQKATLGSNINKVDENDNHTYKIYKNEKPKILTAELKPNKKSFEGYEKNDIKDVEVILEITDDMTSDNDLKLKIGKNAISYATYKPEKSNFRKYTFDGGYDGEKRTLVISVTDEFEETNSVTLVLDNVYKDQAPRVSFEVSSENIYRSRIFEKNGDEKIPIVPKPKDCINGTEGVCFKTTDYFCSSCKPNIVNGIVENGSYSVTINSSITDDLTTTSNMKACITTDKNGCADKNDFSESASRFVTGYHFEIPSSYDLAYKENKTVTIYLHVTDDEYISSAKKEYKLYKNVAPKVSVDKDNIVSAGKGDLNTGNVYVKNLLTVTDDFDDYKVDFCYLVKDKKYDEKNIPKASEILKGNCTEINRKTIDDGTMPFEFKDDKGVVLDYDSQRVYTMYKITDGYGETANSNIVLYKLSANVPPEIVDFTVESSATITEKDENDKEIKKTLYNSIIFDYSFTVYDPEDNYTVCITTLADPDRCDYTTPEGRANFKGMDDNGTPYIGGSDRIVKGQYKVEKFNSYENNLFWAPTINEDGNVIDGKWKYSTNVDELFQQYYYSKGINKTESDHKSETLLLVVADSKGAIAKKEYAYLPRYSCSLHYDNEELENYLANKDIDNNDSLSPEEKEEEKKKYPMEMEIIDETNPESITVNEAKSINKNIDLSNTVDEISPEYCNGLCYSSISDESQENIGYTSISFPKKNDVRAFYRVAISYKDKLVQDEIDAYNLENFSCNGNLLSKFNCSNPTCLDDMNRNTGTKRENNYLISLHLYKKNVSWTYMTDSNNDNFKFSRIPYKSICVEPEAQKGKIYFSKYDPRLDLNFNDMCNESVYNTNCKKTIKNEYDPNFNPEKRDCSKIEIDENDISYSCRMITIEDEDGSERTIFGYEEEGFCKRAYAFESYMDKKIVDDFHKYDGNDDERPDDVTSKYEDAMDSAIESCNTDYPNYENRCNDERKAFLEKKLNDCNNYNNDIDDQIDANNAKQKEYETKVAACTKEKKDACISELNSYKTIDAIKGMEVGESCSEGSTVVYCDSRLMNGHCKKSNCERHDDIYDDDGNLIEASNKDTCLKKCYNGIKCNYDSSYAKEFNIQALCHGYFKLYRSRVDKNNKVIIEDTGMRICPELVSSKSYGNNYSYFSSKRFIKFFPSDYGGVINE